jgi:hypothetical protein
MYTREPGHDAQPCSMQAQVSVLAKSQTSKGEGKLQATFRRITAGSKSSFNRDVCAFKTVVHNDRQTAQHSQQAGNTRTLAGKRQGPYNRFNRLTRSCRTNVVNEGQ